MYASRFFEAKDALGVFGDLFPNIRRHVLGKSSHWPLNLFFIILSQQRKIVKQQKSSATLTFPFPTRKKATFWSLESKRHLKTFFDCFVVFEKFGLNARFKVNYVYSEILIHLVIQPCFYAFLLLLPLDKMPQTSQFEPSKLNLLSFLHTLIKWSTSVFHIFNPFFDLKITPHIQKWTKNKFFPTQFFSYFFRWTLSDSVILHQKMPDRGHYIHFLPFITFNSIRKPNSNRTYFTRSFSRFAPLSLRAYEAPFIKPFSFGSGPPLPPSSTFTKPLHKRSDIP